MLTDKQIIAADANMHSACMLYKENHNGKLSLRGVAEKEGCSHENVRRRYNRHIVYGRYKSLFSHLPHRLSMILVNNLKKRKRTEVFNRTTISDIFRTSDTDLLKIPGIGVGWLATIREAEYEYRK